MNIKLYNELMKERPSQHSPEWKIFLEICEMYLNKHGIQNPVVVELGVYNNKQKRFWEQLLGAEHIGIDASIKRSIPDIHGDTHDPETLKALKEKLKGRPIDILFIDACHHYEHVKKDFEIYSPLCNDIVVLHDIDTFRYDARRRHGVWKFWDELRERARKGEKEYEDFLFLAINQCHYNQRRRWIGIGMIIKK